jgi:hypothetical protein
VAWGVGGGVEGGGRVGVPQIGQALQNVVAPLSRLCVSALRQEALEQKPLIVPYTRNPRSQFKSLAKPALLSR